MAPAAPSVLPLAWSRAAVGALLLMRTTPLLAPFRIWFLRDTAPLLGWPHSLSLAGGAVAALCVLRTVAATMLTVGWAARPAGVAACVTGYAVMAQDPLGYVFTLHLLYQAALVLAITDSSAALAVRPVPARSPRTSLLLMRLWIASIYLWAGIAKLRRDWLDGRTLDLLRAEGTLRGGSALDWFLQTPASRSALAVGVVAVELVIGPALIWRRTRRWALVAAFAFHGMLELVAGPDLLGWGMMALLLCFVEPGDRRALQIPESSQRMASNG